MNPHFLFPSSPLDGRMIDPDFHDQAIALKLAGFGTSVIDMERRRVSPAVPEGTTVVHRGWMMTMQEYAFVTGALIAWGLNPLTSPEQYLAAHHLPNWYPLLERWTPKTVVLPYSEDLDLVGACKALGWEKFQIKDYVKSLKTAGGSATASPEQVPEIVEKMMKYRGQIEGGICIRRWEDFYSNSEVRYFVINGRYYGQERSFDLRHMSLLEIVARDVSSPFFSVDIALNVEGAARVVEIGDGQVSDLVGWTPERFAAVWKEASNG